jgi:hypothetical protein
MRATTITGAYIYRGFRTRLKGLEGIPDGEIQVLRAGGFKPSPRGMGIHLWQISIMTTYPSALPPCTEPPPWLLGGQSETPVGLGSLTRRPGNPVPAVTYRSVQDLCDDFT